MIQCREKTPLIEAYHHDLGHELPEWLLAAFTVQKARLEKDSSLAIDTGEGRIHAAVGDWIVRDATGKMRSWKPDAFARKYEPVATIEN